MLIRTRILLFLFWLSLGAAESSCKQQSASVPAESSDASDAQTTAALSDLTIGYSRLRISLPIFVAKERGIFAKHGLNVQLQVYDTAQPMMQALVESKTNVAAGYTAMPITYAAMLRSEKKLYFLTTMMEDSTHRISYLLRPKTTPGSKPAITSISDLKGKKIGILPTVAYKSWLAAILRANRVDPDKMVTMQQIEPTLEGAALKNGGIDALFTGDPVATAAIRSGIAELISAEVECPKYILDPFPFGSFNVTKAWADTHAELFNALRDSLNEAIDFINTHPTEAKQTMRPYMADAFKDDVDRYPDARYLRTDESTEQTFQEIEKSYVASGIIPAHLDLTGLVITSK